MVRLISPAPYGWANLRFGATSPKPYSPSRPHKGRDWGWYYANALRSRGVVSPVRGTVESVHSDGSFNEGWGNRVVIRVNSRVVVTLNHLLTGSVSVLPGQHVDAGTYVGQMGATGETYGEVHLHEELYIDGARVDPDYYRTHDLPGTEREEDMPLNADADYEAFKTMLQRALKFDVRPNGAGADARLGRTLWEQLNGIEKAASTPVTADQVKMIADAVVAAIGQPTVKIDYAAIAKAVNEDAGTRLTRPVS